VAAKPLHSGKDHKGNIHTAVMYSCACGPAVVGSAWSDASMSRKGNCYDHAFIESFRSSLKYEVVYPHRFATRTEARTAIFDYIEVFYNRTRLHSSLGYLGPIQFESQLN